MPSLTTVIAMSSTVKRKLDAWFESQKNRMEKEVLDLAMKSKIEKLLLDSWRESKRWK